MAQLNTAGMAALEPEILAALEATLRPRAVVLRHDGTARAIEGVPDETRVALGQVDGPVELSENGAVFFADLLNGQKTGWFFDQRENRRFVASLAAGARALDVYCYGGAFAIAALRAGATAALGIDRSEGALALAARSAERNGVAERCRFVRAEAFAELERLEKAGERFDIVFADPPAFVKAKKDLGPGLRGYRKLARLAAALVAKDGYSSRLRRARTMSAPRTSRKPCGAGSRMRGGQAPSCAPPAPPPTTRLIRRCRKVPT